MVLDTCCTYCAADQPRVRKADAVASEKARPTLVARLPGSHGAMPETQRTDDAVTTGLLPVSQTPSPPTRITVSPAPRRGLVCQLSSRMTETAKGAKSAWTFATTCWTSSSQVCVP